jgi:hypothetical protein
MLRDKPNMLCHKPSMFCHYPNILCDQPDMVCDKPNKLCHVPNIPRGFDDILHPVAGILRDAGNIPVAFPDILHGETYWLDRQANLLYDEADMLRLIHHRQSLAPDILRLKVNRLDRLSVERLLANDASRFIARCISRLRDVTCRFVIENCRRLGDGGHSIAAECRRREPERRGFNNKRP